MEPSDVPDASATVLYVGNLDRRVTDVMMLNILRTGLPHIGEQVLSAKMFAPSDPMQGPDGYCFVQFQDNNSACQAMTFLNGRDFCGKKVKVNWATNSTSNGGMPKIIGSSVTIFVGDLDDDITDGELRQAFDPFGEILNAKVVRDATTQKSKNYGFISFNNKPDAEKAIRDMHGAMLKRRPIKTNWATRNQKTQPTSLEYDQVYKETNQENCTVYVTNLPDRITDDVIIKHFEVHGRIAGKPRLFDGKNFCFIKYESHSSATTAIVNSNGAELNGAVLKCWWGKENAADGGNTNSNRPSSNYSSNSNSSYNSQNNPSVGGGGGVGGGEQQQNSYNAYANYCNIQQYQQYYYQWMQYQQQVQQQQQQQGGVGGQQQVGGAPPANYQQAYQQYPQQQYQQQGNGGGDFNQQQGPPQQNFPPQSYQN